MEDRSLYKVGGLCSILLGVSYLLVGVTFMFDTVRTAPNRHEMLLLFAQYPLPRLLNHFTFIAGAFLAMGAIPAISQLVRPGNEGWFRLATNIAYLGIVVTALVHLQFLTLTPMNARTYANGDEFTRSVHLAVPAGGLDVAGWFRYGCLGLWMLIINLLARSKGALSRSQIYLGLVGAVLYMLTPGSGYLTGMSQVIYETVIATLGGLIVGPIWFIWVGRSLYRMQAAQASAVAREIAIAPQ